jgi:hypothetical protein
MLQNAMSNPYSSLMYGHTTLVSFVPVGITPDGDDDVLSAMPMAHPISAARPVLWGGICGGGNAVCWTIGGGGIARGAGFL